MTALVQAISWLSASKDIETETLKTLAMLSGVGLLFSLICVAYGLDLGAEFF
jgi:hypothetical protein